MALFQNAVLKKYLNGINENELDRAWHAFEKHFHNPEIRENIRNAREEEYQDGFLTALFVIVLGYTKYPTSDHNLKVEHSLKEEARWNTSMSRKPK